jgi:carboxylate-amine ligase
MDAIIITNAAGDEELVTDSVAHWLTVLAPVAERLGCSAELEQVRVILRRGASYQRQRAVARRNAGELDAVVASLVAEFAAGRPL